MSFHPFRSIFAKYILGSVWNRPSQSCEMWMERRCDIPQFYNYYVTKAGLSLSLSKIFKCFNNIDNYHRSFGWFHIFLFYYLRYHLHSLPYNDMTWVPWVSPTPSHQPINHQKTRIEHRYPHKYAHTHTHTHVRESAREKRSASNLDKFMGTLKWPKTTILELHVLTQRIWCEIWHRGYNSTW